MKRRTFTMIDEAGAPASLESAVARELSLSGPEARALIERGAVYVQGRRTLAPAARVSAGQKVTVVLEESGAAPTAPVPVATSLPVLFEDADVLAVAKPAGIPAQPTPSRVGTSLLDLASGHLGHPAGLVHRLDRETSGVTVFGKTASATTALAAAFREGTAKKRYLAATGPGVPERGELDLPLSKDPSRPGRWRASKHANGISAFTRFERLYASSEFCLVALYPETGRTHQLRAHLTALDAPILGDRLYLGAPRAGGLEAGRCLLHAEALILPHPRTREPTRFEVPPPEDLAAFFRAAQIEWPTGAW